MVSLLALGSACAHRAECVRHGGTEWREITTDHFRLVTHLPSDEARRYALSLERTRAALLTAWDNNLNPPGKLDAIVLADLETFHEFFPENLSGRWARTPEAGTFVVMHGEAFDAYAQLGSLTLAHELAHDLSHHAAHHQPRWFAEGLASYLETVEHRPDGSVLVGRPAGHRLRQVIESGALDMDALWNWEDDVSDAYMGRLYSSAWLYVHFFMNQHSQRFEQFQIALARNEDPKAAWAKAFGDLSVDALKRAADTYARSDGFDAFVAEIGEVKVTMQERPLSDAEVHFTRARVELSVASKRRSAARNEVLKALEIDPKLVDARVLQTHLTENPQDRLALARAVAADAPDRPEGWLAIAEAKHDVSGEPDDERFDALKRAVALTPDNPRALTMLGWEHMRRRGYVEATPYLEMAVDLAPSSTSSLTGLATAYVYQRRCAEGLALNRRALETLPDEAGAETRKDLAQRLADDEDRCRNRHFLAGGVDQEAVNSVVEKGSEEITACWQKHRTSNPGSLTIAYVIGDRGTVVEAVAKVSTLGGDMERCAMERIRGWQFPAPPKGHSIHGEFPFVVK